MGETGSLGLVVCHLIRPALLQQAFVSLPEGIAPLEGFVHRCLQDVLGILSAERQGSENVDIDGVLVVVHGIDDTHIMAVDIAKIGDLPHKVKVCSLSLIDKEERHLGRYVLTVDAYMEVPSLIIIVAREDPSLPPPRRAAGELAQRPPQQPPHLVKREWVIALTVAQTAIAD